MSLLFLSRRQTVSPSEDPGSPVSQWTFDWPMIPYSAYPVTTDRVFPNIHVGTGSGSVHEEGLGVQGSLGADAIWRLRWRLPPANLYPSGSPYLVIVCLANSVTGSVKINPKVAVVGAGENAGDAALTAIGTQTVTWAAGDSGDYKELQVDLSSIGLAADKTLICDLTFETSGWTLGVTSTFVPFLTFLEA